MAAVAVSPNQTTVGRVTQTLLIHCVARGNVNDSAITFTWKQGDRVLQRNVISGVFGGEAASVLEIRGLSVDEHDGLSIQCHPSNSIGGVNFTEFIISVEPFPAPSITSFRRQDGGSNMATAEWQPLNVSGYPDASFDDYFYEIATDSNGNNIVFNGTVNAGNISLVYSFGDELSDRYWVRVKAVKGDQDVSTFSPWFPITPTRRPPGMFICMDVTCWVWCALSDVYCPLWPSSLYPPTRHCGIHNLTQYSMACKQAGQLATVHSYYIQYVGMYICGELELPWLPVTMATRYRDNVVYVPLTSLLSPLFKLLVQILKSLKAYHITPLGALCQHGCIV